MLGNCPECGMQCDLVEAEPVEITKIDAGRKITYIRGGWTCSNCGCFIEDDVDQALQKANRVCRELYGLLQPEEILAARKKMKLEQIGLLALLTRFGWNDEEFLRQVELGRVIQSDEQDKQLRTVLML